MTKAEWLEWFDTFQSNVNDWNDRIAETGYDDGAFSVGSICTELWELVQSAESLLKEGAE